MADNTYVLDLLVTGAEAVSVNDDGTGTDTIRVTGVYAATIDIDLAYTVIGGTPINADSRYFAADNSSHRLLINGTIENAFGSNGCDRISGSELANLLGGDHSQTGAGLPDTLLGGGGDDTLFGGAGDDQLWGQADDDGLWGDAGNDQIVAGSGSDTVQGGAGADLLDGGGNAGDTVSYAASRGGVMIALQADTTTLGRGGDAEGDQISGFTNVIGSLGADRITMMDKTTLANGASDNQVLAGNGRDKVLLGGGNDLAYGGPGNDWVKGQMGDDSLSGDSGQDKLIGGYGRDVQTGGSSADAFVFNAASDTAVTNPDVITDFSQADQDCIVLGGIDADLATAGNQMFHLIITPFSGSAGELLVVADGSSVVVTGDTNGDMQADFAILVENINGLSLTDFVL